MLNAHRIPLSPRPWSASRQIPRGAPPMSATGRFARLPELCASARGSIMGRRSLSGGVRPAGPDRIQFTCMFAGVRYRPTLPWAPTETTLRRARQHLIGINARIAAGTFSFAEEFPAYRHLKKVPRGGSARTCGQLALRDALVRAGKINHDFLFFKASGQPPRNLPFPGKRWQRTLGRLKNVRYRGSASHGFRKRFGPPRSPRNPLAVTGAVTGNLGLKRAGLQSLHALAGGQAPCAQDVDRRLASQEPFKFSLNRSR
jgi:hypothetical protein